MLKALLVAELLGLAAANIACLPAAWLPEGSQPSLCGEGAEYDGSLYPDCSKFIGPTNYTSFYHVHEYGESTKQ